MPSMSASIGNAIFRGGGGSRGHASLELFLVIVADKSPNACEGEDLTLALPVSWKSFKRIAKKYYVRCALSHCWSILFFTVVLLGFVFVIMGITFLIFPFTTITVGQFNCPGRLSFWTLFPAQFRLRCAEPGCRK